MDNYIEGMLQEIMESISDPSTLAIPNPGLLTYYQNLKERRFWIDFAVDENVLEYARYIIQWNIEDASIAPEERKPIRIYLFNYGGSADIMWMFTDIIQKSLTPVITINMGQCGSAAALIFMAGHKRLMMPSATVTIHEGSNQIGGDAVKVIDQAESYKVMIKKMRNYIISHTKIPSATLNKKRNNDWELDSEMCLKYGVCDKIVDTITDIF